jgi:DNA adenine methylase
MLFDAGIVNVASVRQISPFRYPGGKTWLVPTVSNWLRRRTTPKSTLVDPFAGGASVPLGVLSEGLVDQVVLGERDPDVSAVWQCALGFSGLELCRRINEFEISRDAVVDELARPPGTIVDRAFQTILKNRTFRGGILAPGAGLIKIGENGKGIASRWYPETLVKRLETIGTLRSNIDFIEGDAFPLIERYIDRRDVVFFIDPPYTAGNGKRAGRRLYRYNELDHGALFDLLGSAKGLVLMTYDDCKEVEAMAYSHSFLVERIPMKNTHHEKKFELLISNSGATN